MIFLVNGLVSTCAPGGQANTTGRRCNASRWKLWAIAAALAVHALLWTRRPPIEIVVHASESERSSCAPPSILVAHEQHLQAVGSDRRLLALVTELRKRSTVSLLFRKAAPQSRRSPPTAELASMLGAKSPAAHALQLDVLPPLPPAIYELGDTASLAALLRFACFDLVLIGLWFWWAARPPLHPCLVPIILTPWSTNAP